MAEFIHKCSESWRTTGWHREKWQIRVLLGTNLKQWLNVKMSQIENRECSVQWLSVIWWCSSSCCHTALTDNAWCSHTTQITRIITHSFQTICFRKYSPKEQLNKGLEPKYLLLERVANIMWDQYFCWIFSLFMEVLWCVTLHFNFFPCKDKYYSSL